MEFVDHDEVMGLLADHGVVKAPSEDGERVHLRMSGAGGAEIGREVVRLHLAAGTAEVTPEDGARSIVVDADRLPDVIESTIHKLHLKELLLIPVGKWRNVFDAVAFSLAENEEWQAVDAAATVELNSRDPLLCEPTEYHTVKALVQALLNDAEGAEQGLMLTTTGAPVLVEVVPDGAVRMSFGNQVLADEVVEALELV